MKHGYECVKPMREELLAFMEKHKFNSPADFKGRSLPFFTTHQDLARRQAHRKAARKTTVHSDAEWRGDSFVRQSNALFGD